MSARVSVRLDGDGADGEAIAVKTATTPEEIDALASEAAQLGRACHPGVVSLVEHRETGDGAELRTRFAGEPLDRWRGTLPRLAGLGAAIAATLADLHEMGIVHGRIDGSHVLVGPDGRPRLCGFSPHDGAQPPDDVAALGRLLRALAEEASVSERRGLLAWRRGPHAERRAFEQVVAHAEDPMPRRRPSARALATALLAAVTDAELPPSGPAAPHPSPVEQSQPGRTAAPAAAPPGRLPRRTRRVPARGPSERGALPRDPTDLLALPARTSAPMGHGADLDSREGAQDGAETTSRRPGQASEPRSGGTASRSPAVEAGDDDGNDGRRGTATDRTDPGDPRPGPQGQDVGDPRSHDGTGHVPPAQGAGGGQRGRLRAPGRPAARGRLGRIEQGPDESVRVIGAGGEDGMDEDAEYDDVFGDQTEIALDDLFTDRPWPERPLPVRRRRRPAGAGGGRRLVSRAAVLMAMAAGLTGLLVWIGTTPSRETAPEDALTPPAPSAPSSTGAGCDADAAATGGGSGGPEPTTAAGSDDAEVDVDGDGCPDPVHVEAGVVEAAGERWAIGQPDDRFAFGDWDCDGVATPALYRPATGDVFVFPTWAESGQPLTVAPVAQVHGGDRLSATPADGLGGGCDAPVVELPTGAHHTVEVNR